MILNRTRTTSCRSRLPLALLALGALLATTAWAQGGSACAPIGAGEIDIFDGIGTSIRPAVAVFGDGTGIVVWEQTQADLLPSPGSDRSSTAVVGTYVDSSGVPQGNAFQINTWTDLDQFNAAVAAAPDGRFVAVWQTDTSPEDVDGFSIRGRVYAADGSPRGEDFQVNDFFGGHQIEPKVAMADDGSFVVVWTSAESPGDDTSSSSIQARRFDASGSPRGAQFQVNTLTNNAQDDAAVGSAPDGRFVVVFASRTSGGDDNQGSSIQMRRYDSDGSALDTERQVNVTTSTSQDEPRVAVDSDGKYVVIWQSSASAGSDNDSLSVQARGYLANGVSASNEAQVNVRIEGSNQRPDVAPVGGGEFVAVYETPVDGETYPQIRARAFTLEMQFSGIEFAVASSTQTAAVGANRAGTSLVAGRAIGRPGAIVGGSYSHPCVSGTGVTTCTEDASTLCLNADRFRVTLAWNDGRGGFGTGRAWELTPDTGYFTIFDDANVEVVVKLLNACGFNQRYWAFIAGLTDLGIDLIVEDTERSTVKTYRNPTGRVFITETDTDAFATCP